jgi:hypothetical protein
MSSGCLGIALLSKLFDRPEFVQTQLKSLKRYYENII